MLLIDVEEINKLVPAALRRDMTDAQLEVAQKLLSVYPTDCAALMYYIAKDRPDLIADAQEGKLKEAETSLFIGLRAGVRTAEHAQREFGNKIIFGEADVFDGGRRSGVKVTAENLCRLIAPGVNAASLFRTPKARLDFRNKNNLSKAFRPGKPKEKLKDPKPGQGTGSSS